MGKRIVRLYEIKFLEEGAIKSELCDLLKTDIDVLKETKKTLLASAYSIKDRRSLANHLFKEHRDIQVQEGDFLWAYFAPGLTKQKQSIFRSFYVEEVNEQKSKTILSVKIAYEKQKAWFDYKKM